MNILELAILKKMVGGGGGSGTDNYNDLSNLPQINGETLAGNKTAENLGLQDALTFDSAPTEDSTNPVESGGVYNALAGKQDNLTFDDDPTENSTNPVKSGGVYSALAGKQDNLTFDGVYNASTNKAATESTVTNAIAGLDVSAFSVDADETISSISETDGKINVTKQDIAIASNQVTAMTGYTKPSSAPATPAIQTSDTANQAFGKLEFKADTNQTNILSVKDATEELVDNGAKNYACQNSASLTTTVPTGDWVIAQQLSFVEPIAANTPVQIDFDYTTSTHINEDLRLQLTDSQGLTIYETRVYSTGVDGHISETVVPTANVHGYTVKFEKAGTATVSNIMICLKSQFNISSTYEPYALGNQYLTPELIELCDSGAKNKVDIATATVTANSYVFQNYEPPSRIPIGNYVFTCQSTQTTAGEAVLALFDENLSEIIRKTITTKNGTLTIEFTLTVPARRMHFYTNVAGTFSEFLLCTKAAFGVSQKFVPYNTMAQWNKVEKEYTSTAADTMEYCGVSFTVPANEIYEFIVMDRYSAGNPKGLGVADNSTNYNSNSSVIAENTADFSIPNAYPWARQLTGMTIPRGSSTTYYVWVKRATASKNTVYLMYRRIL